MMVVSSIYATRQRKDILEKFALKYSLDPKGNFVYKNVEEKEKAEKLMKQARVLP